ncbi:hypothetical protein TNCV_3685641 [Trichonephila clavipes]|nr:hypothetical protein TNCV_3685641 [Trichonephila clavipes]
MVPSYPTGNIIRRSCNRTGYSLNAPYEPNHFHRNCRSTTIDIAICKESSFQENPEPYDDNFIDHVEERVDNFLNRSSGRHTTPLT